MPGTAHQRPPRPPQRRSPALLVLAVLVGLLGMHALAPVGGTGHPEHAHAVHAGVVIDAPGDCPGGHCGGHRLHHADPSCASGAVNDGPELPEPLAARPVGAPDQCGDPRTRPATAPDGARAPPSLAELQLLRI
ncbi:DUF6153 family protein [Streptomyces sp. NRRL F-2799]|uniref:DUF6153 family protein n=1 Tax=Streptomyces sp. NRRL F-2799 TaxID=1463844 RepID=UPI001F38989E|nr:DUF6153 family protein [Streptomyces sp. NRRL F-2799]